MFEAIILYLQACAVIALIRAAYEVLPQIAKGMKDTQWWAKPFAVIPFFAFMAHAWFILIFPTIFWPFFLGRKNSN